MYILGGVSKVKATFYIFVCCLPIFNYCSPLCCHSCAPLTYHFSCDFSPTERAPAPPAAAPSNLGSVASYSTSNLASSNLTQVNSTSTVSLSSAVRKRRAPPPPAIPRIAEHPASPAPAPAQPVASQPVDEPSQAPQSGQSRAHRSRVTNPASCQSADQRGALLCELRAAVASRRAE